MTAAQPPGILTPVPLFTAANAAEMARRSHLPTSARAKRRDPADASAALAACPAVNPADYAQLRLSRVRAHLDRLDAALATEKDPLSVERIARALAALSAQEFALAGRPMPGSLRPTAAAARRAIDYRDTLEAPASPAPNTTTAPINPFRRAG